MSLQTTIHRYSLILDLLRRKGYPSFKQIREFLYGRGFEVSERTIQRDVEQIRNEFGIDIEYNRSRNGYYIDEDKSLDLHAFFRFLEIVHTAHLLTDSLRDSKHALEYISFEHEGGFRGVHLLRDLLEAIRTHRKVRYRHVNFHTGKEKVYTLNPYLLREFQDRWYVIGKPDRMKEVRTFGLDRILDLEVLDKGFSPPTAAKIRELFDHVIGLVYSEGDITDVVLSFTPVQGKYIKSLPLHTSQTILKDNQRELRISLRLIPNYELIQKIMMHGETVKVLEPEWLAKEIQRKLKRTLKRYG